MVNAAGDGGSGDEYANGLTNVSVTHMSPFSGGGGGSLNTIASADVDKTLTRIRQGARRDPATIWQMVNGGLKVMPPAAGQSATFVETVWNGYTVHSRLDDRRGRKGGGLLSNWPARAASTSASRRLPTSCLRLADFVTPDPAMRRPRASTSGDPGGNMKYPWI
jgi:hypothetical protein